MTNETFNGLILSGVSQRVLQAARVQCYVGGNKLAPSSGCLVVDQGDVLLVKIMGGSYGPPGGSVNKRESAQCAAERETWEETGVEVRAGELAITV
jgi:ADP-ribose pyrophosphatase YjhB (NUDIX family)